MAEVKTSKLGQDDKELEITVNDKPIVIAGDKQNGLEIKTAAIQQGANIKEDFILSIELGGGKTQLVGDAEEIEIKSGMRFLAIENDDNS